MPNINASTEKSPFKGFLDISIVSQKLRKSLATGRNIRGNQSVKNMEGIRSGTQKVSPSRYNKNNFVNDNYESGDDYAVSKF